MMPIDLGIPKKLVRQAVKIRRVEIKLAKATRLQEAAGHAAPLQNTLRGWIGLRDQNGDVPKDFPARESPPGESRRIPSPSIHRPNLQLARSRRAIAAALRT